MTYDFWATAAIADELRRTIAPGRVQQVLQVDAASLALEVYAGRGRHYLLLSADPQTPRVHLLSDKPRRGVDTASTLLQLLRKYVRGATLTAVRQPPWERVLWLDCQHPEFGRTSIVVELIGRWANLLLVRGVDDFRILECLHRHRPQEGAVRPALPGQP